MYVKKEMFIIFEIFILFMNEGDTYKISISESDVHGIDEDVFQIKEIYANGLLEYISILLGLGLGGLRLSKDNIQAFIVLEGSETGEIYHASLNSNSLEVEDTIREVNGSGFGIIESWKEL